jgi:predicted esterase
MAVENGLIENTQQLILTEIQLSGELERIEKEPFELVILLHGLESSYVDFKQIIETCPKNKNVVLLFPKASIRYMTLFKKEMHSWSDIISGDFEIGKLDWISFENNVSALLNWIIRIKNQYRVSKTVVGGFSQGGFNVWTGIKKLKEETDGMAIFSTSLNDESISRMQFDIRDYPFFYSYGKEDIMMPYQYCEKTNKAMSTIFKSRRLTSFVEDFGHEINKESAKTFWAWQNQI